MTEKDKEHYFDWAATSPPDADIMERALKKSAALWGNPSSLHKAGTEAKDALTEARERCAKSLGVSQETIVFTSGGTESDHIPMLSMLSRPANGTILVSSIEHPAVSEQAAAMRHCGWRVVAIPAGKDGFITKENVLSSMTSNTALVCVMAVNNETGAIQPIYEIADAIAEASRGKRRAKFHVDCVQACGKIPLNIAYPGIDSASFSAHKICGPRGVGILYIRDSITPFLRGGGQEKNIRSGTENVLGALAFAECIERYFISEKNAQAAERFAKQKLMTARFVNNLNALRCCTLVPENRAGLQDMFSPWIVQASFKSIPGQVMVRALDSKGFYISTGSACSSKKRTRPVLEAMRIPLNVQECSVRFSFGPATTEKAMNELLCALKDICTEFGVM